MAKTSFFGSVISGVTGAIKGSVGLGLLGAAVGAAVGLAIFAFNPIAGGMGIAAIMGALGGAQIGVSVGAPLGAITGVIKSREANAPEAQDIINVANIAFAKGVEVGHDRRTSEHSIAQVQEAAAGHVDRLQAEHRGQVGHRL